MCFSYEYVIYITLHLQTIYKLDKIMQIIDIFFLNTFILLIEILQDKIM